MSSERRRSSLLKPGAARRKSFTVEVDIALFYDKLRSLREEQRINVRPEILDAAVFYQRMLAGYGIMELRLDRFVEALYFIRDNFLTTEPMCAAIGILNDWMSVKTYLSILLSKMSDMHSVAAFREGSGELVGIAIASINLKGDHLRTETRIRPLDGELVFTIMKLKSCVFGLSELYDKLGIDRYFRIHALCVSPNHRHKGIGSALVASCVSMARVLHLPACIGGFSSAASQTVAARLGFELLAEMPYKEFRTIEKKETPFVNVSRGEYSYACMALPIEQVEDIVQSPITHVEKSTKKSRKAPKEGKRKRQRV